MNYDIVKKVLDTLGADNVDPSGSDHVICSCLHADELDSPHKGADSNPSMYVKQKDTGEYVYGCFGCQKFGSLKSLIKRMSFKRKVDYSDLLSYLETNNPNDINNIRWEDLIKQNKKKIEFTCKPVTNTPIRFIFVNKSESGMMYLKSRGITEDAIKWAELLYDTYEKRIVFPVKTTDNILYGYTSRSIIKESYFPKRKRKDNKEWDFGNLLPEHLTEEAVYVNSKGKKVKHRYQKIRDYQGLKKKQLILGQHLWKDHLPVFIVEGLFGYLHLLSIGANKLFNIGATMGASLSDHQAIRLKSFGKPVFLLFDNDPAGRQALFGTENSQGAIDKLQHCVVLSIPKWPKITEGTLLDKLQQLPEDKLKKYGFTKLRGDFYKADPDRLTYKELEYMKLNAEIL